MAARKKKGKAGTAVMSTADMEAAMEQYATDSQARVATPTGNVIGITQAKEFTYKQEIIGDELQVLVLDFVTVHAYYDREFDRNNPHPPACFSLSEDGEEMAPHHTSPAKQHDWCDGCPQDAWGSGKGEGKACKNGYRLAVLEPETDPAEAELAIMTTPPSSMKNWDGYIRELASKLKRGPNGVLTLFTFDEEFDYPVLVPEAAKQITDGAYFAGVMSRMEDARKMLMDPFDVSGYEPPAKRGSKKKAKKKAAKKKRAGKFG